jgi:hypothetical protein
VNIFVTSYWGGNNKLGYRLEIPIRKSNRHYVTYYERLLTDVWTRRTASQALDLVSRMYNVDRKKIRFIHK